LRPEEIEQYSAVQLFVTRALEVESRFVLSPATAAKVAAISARLEGLPLAIELAAAWVRALGIEQILERLDDGVGFLAGGQRSAPNRQQTMRATLDWSHGLLDEPARVLFQRLAVFVGGWSLEAAEAICFGNAVALGEVLSLLTRLVDASLVQVKHTMGGRGTGCLSPSASTPRSIYSRPMSSKRFAGSTLSISNHSLIGGRMQRI
jgi:predicted ATPase